MRIGELADKSGVSRDTIRFYERNGLIASDKSESATNNYRNYSEEALTQLRFLTGAREAGMSVADLRGIIEALAGSCDRGHARKVFEQKIQELNERSKQINQVVSFLEQALSR